MKKLSFVSAIIFAATSLTVATAQESIEKKFYWKSASEFIFSWGDVTAKGVDNSGSVEMMDVNPIVRFTCFFHLQAQLHHDFSDKVGFFTGLGIRNVGIINDLNDTIKLKQRSYTLGIPIAFKFGKVESGPYFSVGGEAELFFHYKQKAFYDDEKFKKTEWFSDKVNLFNPSVFIDINSKRGAYIRFKYYLLDFLVEDKQDVKIYGNPYSYFPETSKMFYVSIGATIRSFSSKSSKKAVESVKTTYNY